MEACIIQSVSNNFSQIQKQLNELHLNPNEFTKHQTSLLQLINDGFGFEDAVNGIQLSSTTHDSNNCYTQCSDLVFGFIKSCQSRKKIIPLEIVNIVCSLYEFPDLIMEKHSKYIMNDTNYYSLIHIKEKGVLTADEWNIERQNGGVLIIFCENIILEKGAKINLNSKGYKGGKELYSGHSYNGTSKETRTANFGGGGGGSKNSAGGGGGYGRRGEDGYGGSGGSMYGDKLLSILHLGSGGGGGCYYYGSKGGSGGGALKIHCLSNIILKEDASISCNGAKGIDYTCGCGSGGSIHIIVNGKNNIQMSTNCEWEKRSSITAEGGKSYGNGGIGRIRIEYMSSNDLKYNKNWNITPQPFVG